MVKKVAGIFGIVFLLIGILGLFIPGGMSMVSDPQHAPRLLQLFPVNLLHNIVHLVFGVWGLAAARSWSGARNYARITGPLYLVIAVLGYFVPNGFGLLPLGGHDIWLHILIGVVLTAVGYSAAVEEPGMHRARPSAARA
jgi:hypothetical protein